MDTSIITYELILIVVSILLSAYFSSSETALTSLSELKIKHAMKEYGSKAKGLELWLNHPNKVLNTILFGNNLVNILASVLAGSLMSKLFGEISIGVTTAIMTFVILLFGEITPKTFAKNNALHFAMFSIKILKFFYIIFFPVTWFMNIVATGLLKITGHGGDIKPKMTEDELEFLINVGEKEGILEKEKGEMLTNIFDISDIQVREIMVPRIDVVAIAEDAPKEELLELIEETEFSRIPVYRDSLDNVIGIIYVKDIIRMVNKNFSMKDVLTLLREPLFVPETKKIDAMLKEFQRKRLHMAIVIDEYGGTAGIITMEDILEEIVGDIFDEYDDIDTDVSKMSDNIYLVDSRMNIDDFCDEFEIEKTEDMSEYETLGGLVFDIAGEIPNENDSFEWGGFKFTVKKMIDRRIESIEVERLEKVENNDDK